MSNPLELTLNNCFVNYRKWSADFRAWRATLKYTCEYTGKLFGVSKATVSRWENEKTEPDVRRFLASCAAMQRSPLDYLMIDDYMDYTIQFFQEQLI